MKEKKLKIRRDRTEVDSGYGTRDTKREQIKVLAVALWF